MPFFWWDWTPLLPFKEKLILGELVAVFLCVGFEALDLFFGWDPKPQLGCFFVLFLFWVPRFR